MIITLYCYEDWYSFRAPVAGMDLGIRSLQIDVPAGSELLSVYRETFLFVPTRREPLLRSAWSARDVWHAARDPERCDRRFRAIDPTEVEAMMRRAIAR